MTKDELKRQTQMRMPGVDKAQFDAAADTILEFYLPTYRFQSQAVLWLEREIKRRMEL